MADSRLPDWVRGSGSERLDRARMIAEESRQERDALFQTMYVGHAALRIMRGIQQRGDAEAVLSEMIVDLENEVQNRAASLLAATSLDSPEARDAHFQGRVAASILHRFNTLIAAGSQAADIAQEDLQDGH